MGINNAPEEEREVDSELKPSDTVIVGEVRVKLKKVASSEIAPKKSFKSEVLTPPEITEEKIKEVADFFRLIFNNDWPEWVVCPPCDSTLPNGMRLSAMEVYKTDGQAVPLETMDTQPKIPDCPCCNEKMKIFHDSEKTIQRMSERLKGDGYVSLLKDIKTGKAEGLVYGYGSTLQHQFESEFQNPYSYMAEQDPKYNQSFEHFLDCLRQAFPDGNFDPDTKVFCWNCASTSQRARGNLRPLIMNFFDTIPNERYDLYDIGETEVGSKFHQILTAAGSKDIPGFLTGRETLTGGRFGDYVVGFKRMWNI